MQFLQYTHNPWLVVASLAVALMAGFTGLSLTSGLRHKSLGHRKISVALAAIALGGGIWSMHFVAMLGMQLPVLFYYDAVITLISALIAILIVGCSLLLLHFRPRTPTTLTLAGGIIGIGIVAMHYTGMAGLQLCRAVYTPLGLLLAICASLALSIGAVWLAYGKRTQRNLLLGTLGFGLAVFCVHFVAILSSRFALGAVVRDVGPLIGNEVMAIGVVLSSFVLCGAFLLTGVTFLAPTESGRQSPEEAGTETQPEVLPPPESAAPEVPTPRQIPYEQNGRTRFLSAAAVGAIRAEGHYTCLYTRDAKLFCAWSITEAESRLKGGSFIRAHRSYLINPAHVTRFERLKDSGIVYFDSFPPLEKAPVSRSKLKPVRAALGL
ncbi:MHYT domain-containing protein [Puniceibacterium sediminis]|uniref:MHYT domain-containing protein, NO-binding membrane sensor n=1 Tax=Puniceibacterium sediminis TaxID=1608407 RepID=A0A238WZ62_9RHOB|nr:MHYT domain-containing protein [Puniceibacterium sediminis]SNR51847.1 MHYT domain-containing protein, NO-binding membrane sensor [Puniceibacterium sediminis]